jgi:hypothetical protein
MGGRDKVESASRAVGIESGDAAAVEPESEIVSSIPGVHGHLVMVSKKRDEATPVSQGDELIEDAL